MNAIISSDKYQIVSSGSAIFSLSESITITLDNEFDIVLSLSDDKENPEQRIKGEGAQRGIKLTLINFNNPIGVATTEPLNIAMKNGKKICLALAVYCIGVVRLLQYNILLEK